MSRLTTKDILKLHIDIWAWRNLCDFEEMHNFAWTIFHVSSNRRHIREKLSIRNPICNYCQPWATQYSQVTEMCNLVSQAELTTVVLIVVHKLGQMNKFLKEIPILNSV